MRATSRRDAARDGHGDGGHGGAEVPGDDVAFGFVELGLVR